MLLPLTLLGIPDEEVIRVVEASGVESPDPLGGRSGELRRRADAMDHDPLMARWMVIGGAQ